MWSPWFWGGEAFSLCTTCEAEVRRTAAQINYALALIDAQRNKEEMTVNCEVEEFEAENDAGRLIPSVRVTCGRCGHETESYGIEGPSIRRCLVLLREECPAGQDNFYVTEE